MVHVQIHHPNLKNNMAGEAGFHTGGGGGGARDFSSPAKIPPPPPPQNFESLCTILYGFVILGDFSWRFDLLPLRYVRIKWCGLSR